MDYTYVYGGLSSESQFSVLQTNLPWVLVSCEAGMSGNVHSRGSRLRRHLFRLFLLRQGPLVAQAQERSLGLETRLLLLRTLKLRGLEILWFNSDKWRNWDSEKAGSLFQLTKHNMPGVWPGTPGSQPLVCSSASARLLLILCDISLPHVLNKLQCLKKLAK